MSKCSEKFLPARNYDLAGTLTSGQAFRWTAVGEEWLGVVRGNAVLLRQKAEGVAGRWLGGGPVEWGVLDDYLQVGVEI